MNRLWDIQKKFNDKFFKLKNKNIDKLSVEDKINETKSFILHIYREVGEILNEIPFKMHRNYRGFEVIKSNVVEELIDAQKFLWGLFQVWEVDFKEFYKEFIRKSDVVEQRFQQEHNIEKYIKMKKKICILDIDGVLADYPGEFVRFINKKFNKNYIDMFHIKDNFSIKEIYDLKDEYRKSGCKQHLRLNYYAKEFVDNLKIKGFAIILLSARPYYKYHRIYADTLFWLKKNKIHYDGIIWDSKKDRSILKNFDLKKIAFMVEDNLVKANKISQLGIKVYLLDNQYNKGHELKNVKRVLGNLESLYKGQLQWMK